MTVVFPRVTVLNRVTVGRVKKPFSMILSSVVVILTFWKLLLLMVSSVIVVIPLTLPVIIILLLLLIWPILLTLTLMRRWVILELRRIMVNMKGRLTRLLMLKIILWLVLLVKRQIRLILVLLIILLGLRLLRSTRKFGLIMFVFMVLLLRLTWFMKFLLLILLPFILLMKPKGCGNVLPSLVCPSRMWVPLVFDVFRLQRLSFLRVRLLMVVKRNRMVRGIAVSLLSLTVHFILRSGGWKWPTFLKVKFKLKCRPILIRKMFVLLVSSLLL